jgi:hypothetical protein
MIGIGIGINRLRGSAAFSPAVLFANGEQGGWFDYDDLSTMFQDTAGNTPVTTPGQTIALHLDKSQGLVLGDELLPNSFSSGTWTSFAAGVSVSSGVVTFNDVASGSNGLLLSALNGSPYTTSKAYSVTLTITGFVSGGLRIWTGSGYSSTFSANGTYTFWAVFPADTSLRVYAPSAGANTTLSATISVRELPGNHAVQGTALQRPTYGVHPVTGIRNRLTYTEDFSNAAWSKSNVTVTANAAVAPDGTTTADKVVNTGGSGGKFLYQSVVFGASGSSEVSYRVKASEFSRFRINELGSNAFSANFDLTAITATLTSGVAGISASISALGDGWYLCKLLHSASGSRALTAVGYPADSEVTAGNPNYAADGTSGIFVWGAYAGLEGAYQRVTSQWDVSEAGVAQIGYGSYDGVDDGMVTPTITPGVDKAQVFAGVRKLSDAAESMLLESSTNYDSNNGSLGIQAPGGILIARDSAYVTVSKGTVKAFRGTPAASFSAPISNVITTIGDISGDRATLRVDGTQVAQSTADQGTGNYLAYPLYIGRRGGTTLPANMRLYQLIARWGPNLTDAQIAATENFVAGKTGVEL